MLLNFTQFLLNCVVVPRGPTLIELVLSPIGAPGAVVRTPGF